MSWSWSWVLNYATLVLVLWCLVLVLSSLILLNTTFFMMFWAHSMPSCELRSCSWMCSRKAANWWDRTVRECQTNCLNHWCIWNVIMVARSSDSESEATIIFCGEFIFSLFFFSRHTFSDVGKPTSPKLSHTTWLRNLCYSDFFKVPPKTNGGRKTQNLYHFSWQVVDN